MKNELETICEEMTERKEQLEEQGVNGEYLQDIKLQTLLKERNKKKLGYEPKENQYEEFLDLVSSIGGELG